MLIRIGAPPRGPRRPCIPAAHQLRLASSVIIAFVLRGCPRVQLSLPLESEMYIEPAAPVAEAPEAEEEEPPAVEKPPPLAGPNVMNVVMVGAECAPWSKTGG